MDPYVGGRRVRRKPSTQNVAEVERRCKWPNLRYEPYSMEKRPSFGLWLKVTWLDILTILAVGAVAIGVYSLPPAGMRMFPLTVIDARTGQDTGEVVYPQFAYPYRPQIISSWLDSVLAISIPLFLLIIVQIRVRSFWDLNNCIIGFIYALETSSAFQVMIKWLIGGLRPSFYDICKPDPSLASDTGLNAVGYRQYMFTSQICTVGQGRPLWNAMQSFPSGHSTTICAAAVYLFLYLNAKFKVFANYHPSMWKLVLLYCPILGAALVCGSLTVDASHNWYDILAGAIIGTVFAFSAYRMTYASIWDWRINHIPLNRGSAFVRSDGWEGSDLVFTNRVGWRGRHPDIGKETLPESAARNENMGSHSGGQLNGNANDGSVGPSSGNDLGQPQSPTRHAEDQIANMGTRC
ncbi:acid phosphatase/Vanadium-dependent haloperoxidase [Annulohypoxylon bovei var. microspora]|nr:acid phosphatase/Vanadium-dependent haloperoxidase [Annulohypoxylon bovei var. microspora]